MFAITNELEVGLLLIWLYNIPFRIFSLIKSSYCCDSLSSFLVDND